MTIGSLPVLVLNPHSRCNCRCAMCDIWKTTDAQELSETEIERQLDAIRRLRTEWVVLSGGEAMMHSNLWRLCELLRLAHVRITLLSSGLLLGRYAKSIVEHVDDVIVSLDGPRQVHDAIRGIAGAFDLLAAGVRQIRDLNRGFRISGRCTVQRGNFAHLKATADAAQQTQLDSISFLAADLESTAFNRQEPWSATRQAEIGLDDADVFALEAEIEALIACGDCRGFILESPGKLRRIARHFRVHLGQADPVSPVCNAPWTSAVVEADGSVRPCFFHRPIGNLNSGLTLDQIVNGPEAVAFRESLNVVRNPVCQRCVCSLNWTGSATLTSTRLQDPGSKARSASSRPHDSSREGNGDPLVPLQPSPPV